MFFTPPGLCRILTQPLRWLPHRVHAGGLSFMLNHLLAEPLAEGELDFLRDKVIVIEVDDLGIRYPLRMDGDGFAAAPGSGGVSVRFSGDAHTFLLLATQREDADTLFFQRLLRIEGDTATGLHLKNFLDAFDQSPLPRSAQQALARFTDIYARRCGAVDQARQSAPDLPAG